MTAEQEWETFKSTVLPRDCSDIQINECRKCFFAGMLVMLDKAKDMAYLEEEAGSAGLSEIQAELVLAALAFALESDSNGVSH